MFNQFKIIVISHVLPDKVSDGFGPVVVVVEGSDVLLDEAAHEGVLAKVHVVLEDPVDDGCEEATDE